jgi:hypothetical protein
MFSLDESNFISKLIPMIATLKTKYLPEYPSLFPELIVEAGEKFKVISFPPKVTQSKGTKPYFVYGRTDDGREVKVNFSQTDLNYSQIKKNKSMFT